MYSDDESIASSHSGTSAELHRVQNEQRGAQRVNYSRGSSDSSPVPCFEESDEEQYPAENFHTNSSNNNHNTGGYDNEENKAEGGATVESIVPVAVLERRAIFLDAALFDSSCYPGDNNERVVEMSLRVVGFPFCSPAAAPTETLLYTPVVSAKNMTKSLRAKTVQRWGQQIATQHGIPAQTEGTSTGFEELQSTVRTYRAYIQSYCHTLRNNGTCCVGGSMNAHLSITLDDAGFDVTMPNILRDAVEACSAASPNGEVAFLTTARRHDEVCQCLVWLQKKAQYAFPRYQVFTVESIFGEAWESLVLETQPEYSCGYHDYLMVNNYGNRRHCCKGTVTAMWKVIEAAVQKLYSS